MRHTLAIEVAGAVLVTAACGGPPVVAPITISERTTYITAPLLVDGTPDYAAWLEARHSAGVTAENNAALVLREIDPELLLRIGIRPEATPKVARVVGGMGSLAPLEQALEARPDLGPVPQGFDHAFAAQHARAQVAPWQAQEAPLVAAWLAINEASLARIERALRTRDRWFIPLPGLALDLKLPSLLDLRIVPSAMRARALQALALGDRAAARRDTIAGLRLAALLEQGMWVIDRLIAVAIRSVAAEAAVPLANPPQSAASARALLDALRAVPRSSPIEEALDVNERVITLGAWMDLYRSARRSPAAWEQRMKEVLAADATMRTALGREPASPAFARIPAWAVDWDELFATVNRCWRDAACEAEQAAAQRDLGWARLETLLVQARWQREARRRIARALLTFQGWGSLLRAHVSWNEAAAQMRLAVLSAAAAVARAEHGRYPTDANALLGFEAEHAGYSFAYHSDGVRFAVSARPREQQETGVRGFCADGSGRLTYSPDGTPPALAEGTCDPQAHVLAAWTPPPLATR